jgi:hypothetical protein
VVSLGLAGVARANIQSYLDLDIWTDFNHFYKPNRPLALMENALIAINLIFFCGHSDR